MKKALSIILTLLILFSGSVTGNAEIGELELMTLEGTYQVSLKITNPDIANQHLDSFGVQDPLPSDIIEREFSVDIKAVDGKYLLYSKGEELDNSGLSTNKDYFIFNFMYEVTDSSMHNIMYGVKANLRFNTDTQSFDIIEPQGKINLIYHNDGGYAYIGIGDFTMVKISNKEEEEEPEKEDKREEPERQIPRGITFAKGIVEVKRAGTDKWIRVRGSMPLNPGDIVRTGRNSHAYLGCGTSEFAAATGSDIHLSPQSIITVPDETLKVEKKSRVRVMVDDAMKNVYALFGKEEFEVETPSAVAGIRGTDFIVEVDENGNTTFLLSEGSITVTSNYDNTEITLNPGEKVSAPVNDTLSNPEELSRSDKNAFSEDPQNEEEGGMSPLIIFLSIIAAVIIIFIYIMLLKKNKNRHKEHKMKNLAQINKDNQPRKDGITDSDKDQVAGNIYRYCPKCGNLLASSSRFCKHCGHKVQN